MTRTPPLVAIRCDAKRASGAGHAVRQIALATGLRDAGLEVVFIGDYSEVPFVSAQLRNRRMRFIRRPPEAIDLSSLAVELGARALVVDCYEEPAAAYGDPDGVRPFVVAIVDDTAPRIHADLVVNQNLGSEEAMREAYGSSVLAGSDFAMIRPEVVALRPPRAPQVSVTVQRVLVVLGGTDSSLATGAITSLALSAGRDLSVDVIVADSRVQRVLTALRPAVGSSLSLHRPRSDVARLARRADIVVTAAGSTVWEMCCLGKAMCVAQVADNQAPIYDALTSRGIATGLGHVAELQRQAGAIEEKVAQVFRNTQLRRRQAAAAYDIVDGRGAQRVARHIASAITPIWPSTVRSV